MRNFKTNVRFRSERSSRPRIAKAMVTAILVASFMSAAQVAPDRDGALASTSTSTSTAARHVDCSLRGSGDGSRRHPWTSISQVDEHGPFAPGDRILLRRGTTCRGHLTLSGSGTARSQIRLGAFGRGKAPNISGGGTGEATGAIELIDASHWIVEDLHVTNIATPGDAHRSGVLVINRSKGRLSDITLRRLRVDHVTSNPWVNGEHLPHQFGGISVVTASAVPGAGFNGLTIVGNRVQSVGRTGIVVWNRQAPSSSVRDSRVRISGNKVSRVQGDGILLAGTAGGRIDHNTVAHASNLPKCPVAICPDTRSTASVGIWPIFSRDLRIDHNEAYGTRWGPGDGEGFDIDNGTTNVLFEYNYSHDNAGGGLLLCGSKYVTVRFNIFENNSKSALVFIGSVPAEQTLIYNNTIFISRHVRARPVRYFNGPFKSHIVFKNNLIYNESLADWAWPSRPTTAANTLVGRHGHGRPTDHRTSYRDPHLQSPGTSNNGFDYLGGYKPGNPAVFPRGVRIPTSATRDFFGKRIDPRRPPRGAAG